MRILPRPILELCSLRPLQQPISMSSHRRFFNSSPYSQAKMAGSTSKDVAHSYSSTLNLPRTPFPLKADAAKREILFRKRTTDELYEWQSKQLDRPLFVLHDGPPYANGNLHIGHALNKILKDIINRSKLIQGYRIHYVPGYDTHGLPLELKALSTLKLPASQLSPEVIRAAARKEAEKGVEIQGNEFREFGCIGAFGKGEAYRTMDWSYERRQLGVVREMVRKGLITTHHRPTIYSPSSRTALAEAELEYKEDHESRSVYVAFPVLHQGKLERHLSEAGYAGYESLHTAAWTTTAWTLPSNVALAVSETMLYGIVKDSTTNRLLVIAYDRISALEEILSTELKIICTFPGSDLLSTTYSSPFDSLTFSSSPRPIIPANYVTSTTGTGLVHTSPAHGVEDFDAWRAYRRSLSSTGVVEDEVVCAVDGAGKFNEGLRGMVDAQMVEKLMGAEVLGDGPGKVIEILIERGVLLKEVKIQHKYPYDWRTKKPVIFRASSQWFANLENVKEDAVKAIENVDFYPPQGRKTLEIFVRGRSEWCISRQRAWGVPIPVVYSYPANSDPLTSSKPYLTPSNIDHITSVLESKGSGTDYWWVGSPEEFVEPEELARSKLEGREWRKGTDTLDVWFDSGCSWTLLKELELRQNTGTDSMPFADVYIEGSDQHRGWFQSSLLTAISASEEVVPKAPYGSVVTHGMVLDDKGRKMSKSLGNVTSPLVVIKGGKNTGTEPAYGTDLLRIWVASVDSSGDVPIGRSILAQTSEGLRKIRNSARFMLLNLNEEEVHEFETKELGFIEQYVLNELYLLDQKAKLGYNSFAFNRVYQGLSSFSNTTLSAFYYAIVKDSLYTDSKSDPQRQKIIFTLRKILDTYTSILAPMAPHLAEEIRHFASGATKDPALEEVNAGSIFESGWALVDESWNNPEAKTEMESLLVVREQVTKLLEQARTADVLKSSVEAEIVISNPSDLLVKHFDILKSLFNVSDVHIIKAGVPIEELWQYSAELTTNSTITIIPSPNKKCPRCWSFTRKETEDLCSRCHSVIA